MPAEGNTWDEILADFEAQNRALLAEVAVAQEAGDTEAVQEATRRMRELTAEIAATRAALDSKRSGEWN